MTENEMGYTKPEQEIDLKELVFALWKGKWLIFITTALLSVISVVYALSLPNIYKSEVLLSPVENEGASALGGIQGQLGGLASLAGFNLGGSSSNNTQLAIAILNSRYFITSFIQDRKILPELMAPGIWSQENSTMTYDSSVYNAVEKKWVREVSPPLKAEPSMQEAYKVFQNKVSVSVNDDTGMVTISVEHVSPIIAQRWTEWLVMDINKAMKSRDVLEAEKSTAFLTSQIERTKIADIREILFRLIEEQAKVIMLANVRDEYVFNTVDPPLVPEEKFGPKRALICVLGAMLGGMLGLVIVLIRFYLKKI